jgi:hypothetical protein
VRPPQILTADLPGQPGAELLAHVVHRGSGEGAGLLGAHPGQFQTLDLAGTPAVHHRQQGGLGLMPTTVQVCGGQARNSTDRSARNTRSRGARSGWPVSRSYSSWPSGWGPHCGAGRRGRLSARGRLAGDLGERLIQQDAQAAVSNPAGLELLAVGIGAKPPHLRRSSGSTLPAPGYPAAVTRSPAKQTIQYRTLRAIRVVAEKAPPEEARRALPAIDELAKEAPAETKMEEEHDASE